jgi:HEAT repeat protein
MIRNTISECLLEFSQDSIGPLRETVVEKHVEEAVETNRSVARRSEAARLLGILQKEGAQDILRELLWDNAAMVQLNAALALSRWEDEADRQETLPILLTFLEKGNWLEQNLCDEAVRSFGIHSLLDILKEVEDGQDNSQESKAAKITMSQATLLKQIIRKM